MCIYVYVYIFIYDLNFKASKVLAITQVNRECIKNVVSWSLWWLILFLNKDFSLVAGDTCSYSFHKLFL